MCQRQNQNPILFFKDQIVKPCFLFLKTHKNVSQRQPQRGTRKQPVNLPVHNNIETKVNRHYDEFHQLKERNLRNGVIHIYDIKTFSANTNSLCKKDIDEKKGYI